MSPLTAVLSASAWVGTDQERDHADDHHEAHEQARGPLDALEARAHSIDVDGHGIVDTGPRRDLDGRVGLGRGSGDGLDELRRQAGLSVDVHAGTRTSSYHRRVDHRLEEPTIEAEDASDSASLTLVEAAKRHTTKRHWAAEPENTESANAMPTTQEDDMKPSGLMGHMRREATRRGAVLEDLMVEHERMVRLFEARELARIADLPANEQAEARASLRRFVNPHAN